MDRLRKTAVLILAAGAVTGASNYLNTAPDLCFAAGSVTWRLSAAAAPDFRVAIDNNAPRPDLRIGLVDRVERADFALTDDAGMLAGNACKPAGLLKTVRIVGPGQPADVTIAVAPRAPEADFTLYVHSARVSHFDAAALFAMVRHAQAGAPEPEPELDGGPDTLAQLR
jgi:hypothetical protein